MKIDSTLRKILLASALSLAFSVSSQAQTTLYWDADGSGAVGNPPTSGVGGTSTWDTSNARWWNGTTYNTWNNAGAGGDTGRFADLRGTAGTVTIQAGGVTVGSGATAGVNFNVGGYTLTGGPLTYDSAGGTINLPIYRLSSGASVTINNNTIFSPTATGSFTSSFGRIDVSDAIVTVGGNIGMSSTVTGGAKTLAFIAAGAAVNTTYNVSGTIKNYDSSGSGATLGLRVGTSNLLNPTLILSGNNSFTGGTTILSARVIANNDNALGAGTVTMNAATTGATASLLTGTAVTIGNAVSIGSATTNRAATIGGGTTDSSTFSGGVTWAAATGVDLSLTAASGGTVTVSGAINDGANTHGVVKIGAGVVDLSNSTGNSYDGATAVNAGTLLVSNDSNSATGTGVVTVNKVSASSSTFTRTSSSNQLTVGSTTGLYIGQSVTGPGIQPGTYIAGITDGTTLTLSAPVTSAGTGTLNFGATAGTLGGTGIIAGDVIVNGTIAAGIANNGVGVLSTGALTMNAGSNAAFDLDSAATRGTTYDGITLAGSAAFTLNGGTLSLNFINLGAVANDSVFDLFSFDGTLTGNLDAVTSVGFSAYDDITWARSGDIWSASASNGQTLSFSQLTGDLTIVPEPNTWVLLTASCMAMLFLRRCSRKQSQSVQCLS